MQETQERIKSDYPIIDTHAHYDAEAFDEDRDELLEALPAAGITRVVAMGASLDGARKSLELAERFSHVYAGIGIHPDEVGVLTDEVMEELKTMASHEKCVVYGEIGLDYYWNIETREVQKEGFIRQLELAKQLKLPINVHSREAAQDTFDIIKAEHAGHEGGVIHCFSGSVEMAKEYVKLGYHLGIGGVLTFKNARVLKEVVTEIPLEYLVTETDSPYLAPVPHRGKRNDSRYIPLIIEEIAALKQMTVEETARVLYRNALNVYRWKE